MSLDIYLLDNGCNTYQNKFYGHFIELEFTLIFWSDNRNQYVSMLTTHRQMSNCFITSSFSLHTVLSGTTKTQMEVETCQS
jgi:hypothetical protein